MILVYSGGIQEELHAAALRMHASDLNTVVQMLEKV